MFNRPRIRPEELAGHHVVRKTTRVVNLANTDEQLAWPNERTLAEIEKIYGFSFTQLFQQLQPGSRVLDIGPGRGFILTEIAERFPLNCYGIATNRLDAANERSAKEVTYYAIPESKSWLQRHRAFFDVCLDTYSCLTYAPNALHSLLYIMLSIKPGGKLCSMSSLTPDDLGHSRFGNPVTRVRIATFFRAVFNVELYFDYVKILSKVCKPGQMMDDLRVTMLVPAAGLTLPNDLQGLSSVWELFQGICQLADNTIGVPVVRPNSVAFSAGDKSITTCDFIAPEDKYPRLGWR